MFSTRSIVSIAASLVIFASGLLAAEDDFEARVRDYILRNPEVIMEALAVLAERERQAEIAARVSQYPALFSDPAYHGLGDPEARLRVVEFFDYKCAPCKAMHAGLVDAVAANPDLRIEMRHLPILTPSSERAARYALAVRRHADPEAYARVHDAIWTRTGPLGATFFERLSTEEGLDHAQIEAEMYGDWVNTRIDTNRDIAIALEILGTPAFITPRTVSFGQSDVDALVAGWRSAAPVN